MKTTVRKPNTFCPICNNPFYVRPNYAKNTKFNTCSNLCRSKFYTLYPKSHASFKNRTYNEKFFVEKCLRLKMSARKRNISFSESLNGKYLEDLWDKQKGRCFYTNIEMSLTNVKSLDLVSVDRVDNSKGYTEGNLVLCTYAVNSLKFSFSPVEIKEFINQIISNHESKNKKS